MTAEEFWICDVTVGNQKTSTTVTQRCSVLVNCDPESCSRDAPCGLNWNQHGMLPRTRGARVGFACEFVGNNADDPMTKNIQNSTGRNDTIIPESLSGPSISVISKVDNIRRRLQRAMRETGLLDSQDIDKWWKTALTRKARSRYDW